MESNAFASLAVLICPPSSRLLQSACCPDKDLVAVVSRLGGQDRLSLWKLQGQKTWEVDVGIEDNPVTHIVGLAWSPDGQSIAVAHDPPCLTLHSIQDGHREFILPIASSGQKSSRITNIWWFAAPHVESVSAIPDIFKRQNIITGSAHSVLKILPLLDNFQEYTQKSTATDLFAFQGSQTRQPPKSSTPTVISSWPTLAVNPFAASISPPQPSRTSDAVNQDFGASDSTNINSILVAADDSGHMFCFLDGTFPLGAISLGSDWSIGSMHKHPHHPKFYINPRKSLDDTVLTGINPLILDVPLLNHRSVRDLAMLSSTSRQLVWYVMRVVKDMRSIWFGSESAAGARELGPKWVRALTERQSEQFGDPDPSPILDLTCLLVSGRASDPLLDSLGSSDQTSERALQKWESVVSDALIKLRDFSEKRVAPACQRLHLLLEEMQGWAHLPQYASFELPKKDLDACVALVDRAIVIASWLAAIARRELSRFREFLSWLRFETMSANPPNDNPVIPRHDILEVNHYLMSGLVVSQIDKWFMGPVPQFTPSELTGMGPEVSLASAIQRCRVAAQDPTQVAWKTVNTSQRDLNHLDRNLDALVQDLATRCQRIFDRAAQAAARAAVISSAYPVTTDRTLNLSNENLFIRERIIRGEEKHWRQYLAMSMPFEQGAFLCMGQIDVNEEGSELTSKVGVVIIQCYLAEEEKDEGRLTDLNIVEAEFFDDETLVIVYRLLNQEKTTGIATIGYNDLGYQGLVPEDYVKVIAREDLMLAGVEGMKQGKVVWDFLLKLPSGIEMRWKPTYQLVPVRLPIKRSRVLTSCKTGAVSLAVNGRTGRRVACVMDHTGTSVETFDMEGEMEEMEVEGESPSRSQRGGG